MKAYDILLTCPIHERVRCTVPGFGIGMNKKITLPCLIEQMQEVALLSTRKLGVSVFDLEPLDLGWVLMGQRIDLNHLPALGTSFDVITAPVGFRRVFTYRDFHFLDTTGHSIGSASTTWMLMNLKSRRMASLPDFIKQIDAQTPAASAHLPQADYKLVPPGEPDSQRKFRVGYHELDFNGHLTNPVYVKWMLEGLDLQLLTHASLRQLNVQYGKEARYGDLLRVVAKKTAHAGNFLHGLYRDNELLASMQTSFKL